MATYDFDELEAAGVFYAGTAEIDYEADRYEVTSWKIESLSIERAWDGEGDDVPAPDVVREEHPLFGVIQAALIEERGDQIEEKLYEEAQEAGYCGSSSADDERSSYRARVL